MGSEQKQQMQVGGAEASNSDFFDQLIEFFPDIVHSVDEHGRILSTNQKASELLGYTRAELIGKSVFDIYPEQISRKVRSGLEALKKKGRIESIQSKLQAKDGTIIDVEIRSLAILNAEGKFQKTFSIIRDVRELNHLRSQVQQSAKLAAIGELAAGIMHDIRNPLTVISAYNSTFLPKALQKGDMNAAFKAQEKIAKGVERIERLSNHLRSFTRNEKQEPTVYSLASLIDDCKLMVESRVHSAGATLEVEGLADIKLIGRPHQLEQVFINLIANAADALESCQERCIYVRAREVDDKVVVEVQDTGPGIPKKVQEQIFESFFTTKEQGKGTGLGLSICKGIVYDEQGTLELESEPNQGALFRVTLPKDIRQCAERPSSEVQDAASEE